MLKNLLGRLGQSLLVLLVLFTITFFLIKQLPGGPFDSEKKVPEHIKKVQVAYYGLDKSLPEQYLRQLKNLLRGDPGVSMRLKQGQSVAPILVDAFPVSLQIGIVAMTLAIGIGIPAGAIAAARKNSLIDNAAMMVAMTGICLPSFVIGPLLAEWLGRSLGLFPVIGWSTANPGTWLLPALTLGLGTAAYLSRLTRAGMLETLSQDFVRTARAKGVPGWKILVRHCLRGGLIPAVAFIGPAFAGIISGSVVIESIFQIPGLGRIFIKAIETRDGPIITAIVLFYGCLVIVANFLTDLAIVWLNPRLRSKKS